MCKSVVLVETKPLADMLACWMHDGQEPQVLHTNVPCQMVYHENITARLLKFYSSKLYSSLQQSTDITCGAQQIVET